MAMELVDDDDAAPVAFDDFVVRVERRLRSALIAAYGPVDGRVAAVDAIAWAWEHWDRVRLMSNPVGYLFRVGQTAARANRDRPIPIDWTRRQVEQFPDVHPELVEALGSLSGQQRTVVMLIHAFGWTQRDVAGLLGISSSSVQTHVERAVERLRDLLEVNHED